MNPLIKAFIKTIGINEVVNWNQAKCKHIMFKAFKKQVINNLITNN
jgi:hypothetical protein